jgi:hypothetical protein
MAPLAHNVFMAGKHDTLENRLWAKIEKRSPTECWPWLANKNNKGYGMIRRGGSLPKALAHRVVFEISNGAIPEGLVVMHSCDNPACCNPDHLTIGTMLDNCRDMIAKGRKVVGWNPANKPPIRKGEEHGNAKLSEVQAREIKASSEKTALLCEKYGVKRDVIKRIRSGRSWSHL